MKKRAAGIAAIAIWSLAMFGGGYAVRETTNAPLSVSSNQRKRSAQADDKVLVSTYTTSPAADAAQAVPLPTTPFDVLKSKAMAGDIKAMRELFWRYDECYYYNAPRNVSAKNLNALARTKPQFRAQAEWIKEYRRKRCLDVEGGRSYDSDTIHQWPELLSERGDPVGELMTGTIAEGKTDAETLRKVVQIVEQQRAVRDPEVAYMLSLVNDQQALDLPDDARPLFQGYASSYAWQIAACRAGYDGGCGWGSRVMNQNCEMLGFCQYTSLEQMVLDLYIPLGRRAEFLQTVRDIRARFL